jgi:hypothetical protein
MDGVGWRQRSVWLGMALAAGVCACAGRREVRGLEVAGLDRKLSTFAYIEQGDLVTFIVDTRPTRYRAGQPYIPIEICVANNGVKRLTLTRESFTLVDEERNRYPAAEPRELMQRYEFLDFDRSLNELQSIVFNKFAAYTRYDSNFSPTRTSTRLVRDVVTLPRFGYIIDYLYFPSPRTGITDRTFELFLESPELVDPVFVKFMVK